MANEWQADHVLSLFQTLTSHLRTYRHASPSVEHEGSERHEDGRILIFRMQAIAVGIARGLVERLARTTTFGRALAQKDNMIVQGHR